MLIMFRNCLIILNIFGGLYHKCDRLRSTFLVMELSILFVLASLRNPGMTSSHVIIDTCAANFASAFSSRLLLFCLQVEGCPAAPRDNLGRLDVRVTFCVRDK